MTDQEAFKYSRRGAASFQALPDREVILHPHHPQAHLMADATTIYSGATGQR